MWFPIIQHGDSVIEARHSDGRWRFRRRTTKIGEPGFFVTTRGDATTGLGWLLDESGPGPIDGLHPAAQTVMRGARDYVLRELRTAWWTEAVDSVRWDEWPGEELEELRPPRLPWNAHIVHHYELLGAWRARNVDILPLVDLEALVMAGTTGPEADHAWERYIRQLDEVMSACVPGPPERVATFGSSFAGTAPRAVASLVRDTWHWGLALGDEDANVLPPQVGAELAWRLASCLTDRHRAALSDDVVMLAQALRHVPDPREPFAVLVHGRCFIRARWRLGVWEWSASYATRSEGFWRRGDFASLLRSDLLSLGPPTYLHPAVEPLVRDAFELAVAKRGHVPVREREAGPYDAEDATWRELLGWAEEGQIVDCLIRADFAARRSE